MRYKEQFNSEAKSILKDYRERPVLGVPYRGVVVDSNDPSNTGRVKVNIPALYVDIPDSELPWALPCFSNASYKSGSFIIPETGSYVWLLFENNDIYKPVWIGCIYTIGSPLVTQTESGNAQAYVNNVPSEGINPRHYVINTTPKGSTLVMNDEDGSVTLSAAAGGGLQLNDKTMGLVREGESFFLEEGSAIMRTEGGQVEILDSDKAINIKRDKTQLNIKENESITLKFDENKKIEIDTNGIKIHLSEGKTIEMTEDSILIHNDSTAVEMFEDKVNITASSTININAPSVNVSGD